MDVDVDVDEVKGREGKGRYMHVCKVLYMTENEEIVNFQGLEVLIVRYE